MGFLGGIVAKIGIYFSEKIIKTVSEWLSYLYEKWILSKKRDVEQKKGIENLEKAVTDDERKKANEDILN